MLHPRSRVQCAQGSAHTSIQVQPEHSGIPCAMALRLMPCSPRRRIRLASVAAGLMADRSGRINFATDSLAPATGVGTTRFCRTHQRRSSCALEFTHGQTALRTLRTRDAAASTASKPASVTIAIRPCCRVGMAGCSHRFEVAGKRYICEGETGRPKSD